MLFFTSRSHFKIVYRTMVIGSVILGIDLEEARDEEVKLICGWEFFISKGVDNAK